MHPNEVTIINYTAPELNHLAAGADEARLLTHYVRPYANLERGWERVLSALPGASTLYGRTFGRRRMPQGLRRDHLHEAAIATDLLGAFLRHFPAAKARALVPQLHWRTQKRIAQVGAHLGADSKVIVASYLVAEPAFRCSEGIKVLNYPIAHHRFIQQFVAEEAERVPEFAETLPDWAAVPSWIEPRLDAECALADHILVGSSFVRDSFVAEGVPEQKLVVIPYGANVSTFCPASESDRRTRHQFRLLFVGQMSQRKGISYLLRAYAAFHGPGTRLTLIGGLYGSEEALTPHRHLFEHIPHIPHAELAGQYRNADVFVFPTLIEGMPLVVLEAMASGLPVITTPNGPGDIVRDGVDGFVVPIRDPDAIVEKLEYLRANPERRREMGASARQRALEFSWMTYRQRSIATLRSLMDGQSNPTIPDATASPMS